jgi:hypothetical protein
MCQTLTLYLTPQPVAEDPLTHTKLLYWLIVASCCSYEVGFFVWFGFLMFIEKIYYYRLKVLKGI